MDVAAVVGAPTVTVKVATASFGEAVVAVICAVPVVPVPRNVSVQVPVADVTQADVTVVLEVALRVPRLVVTFTTMPASRLFVEPRTVKVSVAASVPSDE